MFATIIIGFIVAVIGGLIFGLIFMRSSKELPRQWSHWRTELIWQYIGMSGMVEDHLLRHKNVTDLVSKPGKLAVITGGNRGIGLRVVEKLLECDMTIVMGVRDPDGARKAIESTLNKTLTDKTGKTLIDGCNERIYYAKLDTGSMESVREFAKYCKKKFPKIDILINNAGIMAAPYQETIDGFESQLAINYLGHFLLTHLLLPELKAAGTMECRARIINVSSCVHKVGRINFDDIHGKNCYYPPDAYNQSKLAQVLFTKQLDLLMNEHEPQPYPIQVHAVHPGVVDTDLFCHSSSTYIPWFKKLFFKNAEEGSRTIVHAAISPKLEGKGGSYLSNCQMMHSKAKDKVLWKKFFDFTCKILKIENFDIIKE